MSPRLLYASLCAMMLAACAEEQSGNTGPLAAPTAPPAFAASANASFHFREPVVFELTPEVCRQLTTTVTGTGTLRGTVHLSPDGSGGLHFNIHTSAQGTATGADGSSYRFSYNNNTQTTKEPVPPFEVRTVDKFRLNGQGSTPDLFVKQYYDFILNPDGSFTDLRVRVRGDPFCDPI